MLFTFVTITYMHEKYIVEHLESIKYQIVNFGNGHRFQLIVADDNSTDNTISNIKRWLTINECLFEFIDILTSNVNQGTCKNYTRAIRAIKGDYFKALAGDDLFGAHNIFDVVDMLKEYDIICTAPIPFSNTDLFFDKRAISSIYSVLKFTDTSYATLRSNFIALPRTPGLFISKEILTEKVLNFIEEFTLIEDYATCIKIYEENNLLRIGYHDKILVFYRHHEKSVTRTSNKKVLYLVSKDRIKLFKYVLNKSKSILVKIKILLQLLTCLIPYKQIAMVFNFEALFYRLDFLLSYNMYKERVTAILRNSVGYKREYLEFIVEEASKISTVNISSDGE